MLLIHLLHGLIFSISHLGVWYSIHRDFSIAHESKQTNSVKNRFSITFASINRYYLIEERNLTISQSHLLTQRTLK